MGCAKESVHTKGIMQEDATNTQTLTNNTITNIPLTLRYVKHIIYLIHKSG